MSLKIIIKILMLSCQLSADSKSILDKHYQFDRLYYTKREIKCIDAMSDCFKRLREAYSTDLEAAAACIELKSQIGY